MEIDYVSVTINSGQSLSPEVDVGNKSIVGIQVPTTWVTAAITFQASVDGGATFGEVWDGAAGAAYTVGSLTGGTLKYFAAVDPAKLRGAVALKIRSGTQAAPVAQTAAGGVTLTLVTRLPV